MIPEIVLASGSPRRREILDLLGLRYEIRAPEVSEVLVEGADPGAEAIRLACDKARAVSFAETELVVAADTLVAVEGRILGKPLGERDAVAMLKELRGRRHEVYSGLALILEGRMESGVAVTSVWFRSLDDAECEEYVATGEPLDKAGAYGIQGLGASMVQRIEGEYFNVMGLPVQLLLSLLARFELRYAFGRVERA